MTDEEKAEKMVKEITKKWVITDDLQSTFLFENRKKDIRMGIIAGLAEGRKERNCVNCSNHGKQFEVMKLAKENAEPTEALNNHTETASVTQLMELIQVQQENKKLKARIEKMKCCGNCGNDKCTSKYRGNSAYHRQSNGFACADNEDWIPRKMELAE